MSLCPTRFELEQLYSSAGLSAEVEQHLAVCEHCRQVYAEFSAGDELLAEVATAHRTAEVSNAKKTVIDVGDVIGGYRLTSRLFNGGQAQVFRGEAASNPGRAFAIKIWNRKLDGTPEHRVRFERECQAVSSFQHEGIVAAIRTGIEDKRGFLVMPLIDGIAVDAYADSLGDEARQIDLCCQLMIQVCDAVAYAHSRGTLHRDLKPSNILVESSGVPRLLDFGLSKAIDQSESGIETGPTMTGQFLGTLAYASPEQTTGKPDAVDVRSDVYSLGVIAYRVFTGRLPYRTSGPIAEVLANIQSAEPEMASRWNPEINRDLDAILAKALAKNANERYQTANALKADFCNYLSGDFIEARRNSQIHLLTKALRRNALTTAVVAMLFISLTAACIATAVALAQSNRALKLSDDNLRRERELAEAAEKSRQDVEQRAYLASITAATMAGDPRSAREWLDEAPLSLRQWEWKYLRRVSDQTGQLLEGHERFVECVRPAGKNYVLSTGWEGVVRKWDIVDGVEVANLKLHKHVWGLAVSPDQKTAIVGDFDGRLHILNIEDMTIIDDVQGPDAPVFGCAFSPDGERLACTFSKSKQSLVPPVESTICIFDTQTWETKSSIDIETSTRGVEYFQQDQWFVSGLSHSALVSESGGLVRKLPLATSLAYSADTQSLFLSKLEGPIHRLDVQTFESEEWISDSNVVNELDISPDGKLLAAAGRESRLRTYSIATGEKTHERVGHDWAISSCAFIDDAQLVTGGWDKTVRTWNLNPGSSACEYWQGHTAQVTAVLPVGSGRLVSGGKDQTIRLWDIDGGRLLQTVEVGAEVWAIAHSPKNNLLCIGLSEGQVVQVALNGSRLELLQPSKLADEGNVHDVIFCGENQIMACTANNLLVEYDLKLNRAILENRKHRGHLHRVMLTPDGRKIVSADHDVIRVWDRASRKMLQEFKRSIFRDDFSLQVTNDLVIAGRNPGQIGIWSLEQTGLKPETLNGHGDEILDLAIHPNGTRLVSCSADGSTKIWDLPSRRLLSVIQTGEVQLQRVAFDPEGNVLFGGSDDGRLLVWDERNPVTQPKGDSNDSR